MKVDFARLNYILIPEDKSGRDRMRAGVVGKTWRLFEVLFGPFTREGRVAMLMVLIVGAFGLDLRRTTIHVLFAVMFALVAVSRLARRFFPLPHVTIHVRCPPRVALGDEITFSIVCNNSGKLTQPNALGHGPFLPWDGKWSSPLPLAVDLPTDREVTMDFSARFISRGEHMLDGFSVGALLPWGLASGPFLVSNEVRFIVVPRPASIVRIALPAGRKYQPGGVALASKSGDSMDLLGVRPYRPGDPARDLHPRSWARTGIPMVREYQEEYFTRIGVVLDTDQTVSSRRRLEASIRLAAGVVSHLCRGDTLIDLLVIGGEVHNLTLGRSLGRLDQALDLLACVERGPSLDGEQLLQELSPHLSKLSCVVFVAAVDDDDRRAFAKNIEHHGVACLRITVDDARAEAIERDEDLWL